MGAGKILITGANGFVGTHLVEQALAKGFEVFALVRESSNTRAIPNGVHLLRSDIRDKEGLRRVVQELKEKGHAIDYIVHAAAITKSNSQEEFIQTNYEGTRNLLSVLESEAFMPQKFVFVSSLAACGPEKINRIVKPETKAPVTQYGRSKLMAEEFIISSIKSSYLIIRPTAVYGPREKDLFSVFKLINKSVNPVLGFNEQQLTFIYVKDLAELILEATVSPIESKIYFATDGHTYSKSSLPQEISAALDKRIFTLRIPLSVVKALAYASQYTAPLLGRVSVLNNDKYKEITAESWNCDARPLFYDLKMEPKYDLRKGVRETVEWYKQHNWI